MTGTGRIQRLTELARRVWPERGPYLVDVVVDHLNASIWSRDAAGGDVERISIYCAHNALDALEAALLVLAGEAPLVAAGQGAVCKLAQPPAWVEQLASEWNTSAKEIRGVMPEATTWVARVLNDCAADLRGRAKEAGHG